MIRPTFLALSLILVAAPGLAAEPLYRASLAAPAASRVIVKDVAWSCAGAACSAPRTATLPDANVCTAVARKLGRLTGFEAGGRAFEAAELEKCNAAAN
jgi:hypothetical protein